MSFLHRFRTYHIAFQSSDYHFIVLKKQKTDSPNGKFKDIGDKQTAITKLLKYCLILMHLVAIRDVLTLQEESIPLSFFLQFEQIFTLIMNILRVHSLLWVSSLKSQKKKQQKSVFK